jgi:polysaccharide chain length determinant protein (PEP-CTERM system associated)
MMRASVLSGQTSTASTVEQNLATLRKSLRDLWRYRWHAAAFTWSLCIVGWALMSLIPGRYQATARVYVDTHNMLRPLLVGLTVEPNVEQQLAMMTRTLISRPNIERAVEMAGLGDQTRSLADKERVLDRVAKNIELRGGDVENLYTISYSDRTAADAKHVVESLLKLLFDDNKGEKRKDAGQARHFLAEQIATYERKLSTAENTLREFKQRNLGFVPGQDYFSRLNETSSNLATAKLQLREAERRRDALRKQMAGDEPTATETFEPATNSDLDVRLQSSRRSLDNLRQSFTEDYPDVVAARRAHAQLEEQRKQAVGKTRMTRVVTPASAAFPNLKLALAESEANVASLQARVGEYDSRHAAMTAAASRAPLVEAEYAQLNRDYEVNRQNFEKLLNRRESAQMTEEMDAAGGARQFRVVDPPRVPLAPSWPNRPLLMSLVLIIGIGGGVALAVGLGYLRPTFADRVTLREMTGLSILGALTRIKTDNERRRQRRDVAAWTGAYAGLLVLYGGIMATLLLAVRTAVSP